MEDEKPQLKIPMTKPRRIQHLVHINGELSIKFEGDFWGFEKMDFPDADPEIVAIIELDDGTISYPAAHSCRFVPLAFDDQ